MIGTYLYILPVNYEVTALAEGKVAPTPALIDAGSTLMKCIFATQILFWATLYSVKCSLLLLFRTVAQGLPYYERLWWVVIVMTALSLIGCIICEVMSCQPTWTYFAFGMSEPSGAMDFVSSC